MKLTKKQIEIVEETKQYLIKEQNNGDQEGAHLNADAHLCGLLVALGFKDIVDEYDKIDKWYA